MDRLEAELDKIHEGNLHLPPNNIHLCIKFLSFAQLLWCDVSERMSFNDDPPCPRGGPGFRKSPNGKSCYGVQPRWYMYFYEWSHFPLSLYLKLYFPALWWWIGPWLPHCVIALILMLTWLLWRPKRSKILWPGDGATQLVSHIAVFSNWFKQSSGSIWWMDDFENSKGVGSYSRFWTSGYMVDREKWQWASSKKDIKYPFWIPSETPQYCCYCWDMMSLNVKVPRGNFSAGDLPEQYDTLKLDQGWVIHFEWC